MLRLILILVVIGAVYWFNANREFLPEFTFLSEFNPLSDIEFLEVSQPPGIWAPSEPYQGGVNVASWQKGDLVFTPLASFSLRARVLGKNKYTWDSGASIAPYDLALGWQKMSDSRALAHVHISQDNRRYTFFMSDNSYIGAQEASLQSANMHMIPGSQEVLNTLDKIRKGNIIVLSGYLVRISGGYNWSSSLTRADSGDGACELVWVTSLRIEH